MREELYAQSRKVIDIGSMLVGRRPFLCPEGAV